MTVGATDDQARGSSPTPSSSKGRGREVTDQATCPPPSAGVLSRFGFGSDGLRSVALGSVTAASAAWRDWQPGRGLVEPRRPRSGCLEGQTAAAEAAHAVPSETAALPFLPPRGGVLGSLPANCGHL